jgi:hypothetical protein
MSLIISLSANHRQRQDSTECSSFETLASLVQDVSNPSRRGVRKIVLRVSFASSKSGILVQLTFMSGPSDPIASCIATDRQ